MQFTYPVAERALKKWSLSQLDRRPAADGSEHFSFTYHGSTCNNGGTAFTAILHAIISGSGSSCKIEQAWIEIPDDQKEGASRMCTVPGNGVEDAGNFFSKLSGPADFTGRYLESVIMEEVSQNFAGCFCATPHINQKWKIAFSTMHYAMT